MDGPRGYLLNEISQISYMWNYDFTYIWNLKNKMNFKKWKQTNKKKNGNRLIDTEKKQVVSRGEGAGE